GRRPRAQRRERGGAGSRGGGQRRLGRRNPRAAATAIPGPGRPGRRLRPGPMTLRQLEYLVAIAETGSFTLAATRLHVSQPTLSQQIRTLELETGVQLIERLSRGVKLTPAGKAMYAEAQATLASARRALESSRRAAAQEPQLLTLATVRSLAVAVLPVTVTRWRERHPEMSVRMLEFASRVHVAAP